MTECLFCKIAAGEIESYKVYEDSDVLAFLDINPLTLGHSVIIPKKHYSNIIELPDEFIVPVFLGVKRVAEILAKTFNAENFTIGINHGKMLGNPEIDHMHIHVIPRFEGDGGGDIHSIVKQSPDEALDVTYKRILENK